MCLNFDLRYGSPGVYLFLRPTIWSKKGFLGSSESDITERFHFWCALTYLLVLSSAFQVEVLPILTDFLEFCRAAFAADYIHMRWHI